MGEYSRRKGYRFEVRARRLLEGTGHAVMRAGGSLGAFDVLAWTRDGPVRAIQVKGGAHPYAPPHEIEAMRLAPLPAGATRELWKWKDYARHPVIEVV